MVIKLTRERRREIGEYFQTWFDGPEDVDGIEFRRLLKIAFAEAGITEEEVNEWTREKADEEVA